MEWFYSNAGIIFTLIMIIVFATVFVMDIRGNRKVNTYKLESQLSRYRTRKDDVSMTLFAIYFVFVFLIILYSISKEMHVYSKILVDKVNDLEAIIISYVGIVVAVIVFSIASSTPQYYLNITIAELNKHYKVGNVYQLLGVSTAISIICTFALQGNGLGEETDWYILAIYELCCILVLLCGGYALYMVGAITMGDKRLELYSLKNLYKIFWNNSMLDIVNDGKQVIYKNLEYLLDEYKNCMIVKYNKFEDIHIIKYEDDIESSNKMECWYQFALSRFLMGFLFINAVLSMPAIFLKSNYVIFVNCMLIVILVKGIECTSSLKKYVINLVLNRSGYVIKTSRKELFIGRVSIYHNIFWEKYVRSIENLMALYCMLCKCSKEKKLIEESLDELSSYFDSESVDMSGVKKALYCLPVFLCGFYYYSEFKMLPSKVKKLYQKFKLGGEEEKKYKECINAFIGSACRFRYTKLDKQNIEKKHIMDRTYYENYIDNQNYWKEIKKR